MSIRRSFKFLVTEEGDMDSGDSSSPWISAEYKARSKEETCRIGAEDPR